MPAIQQQRTNIKNAGGGARKIIGKFNPLILGEVHTAGNIRQLPAAKGMTEHPEGSRRVAEATRGLGRGVISTNA
jgi:hypothetical protein